jgi:predicted TIM-barrel fold metal-dependent hydrolase
LLSPAPWDRCENLQIILSHAGGFLPYAAYRLAPLVGRGDPAIGLEVLRRFYLDVALSSTPTALLALLAFANPANITYGSDFPYAPASAYEAMAAMLDAYELTDAQRHSIDHGNATRVFPRLAEPSANPAVDGGQRIT